MCTYIYNLTECYLETRRASTKHWHVPDYKCDITIAIVLVNFTLFLQMYRRFILLINVIQSMRVEWRYISIIHGIQCVILDGI